MTRPARLLLTTALATTILFAATRATADNPAPDPDAHVRALIKEEVDRQLNERVAAEVKRQLAELAQQHRTKQDDARTRQAKVQSARSITFTLRSQLELYALQHGDNFPTLAQLNADWSILTESTDASGATGPRKPFGPYLQSPPRNPFNNSSTVTPPGKATAKDGWTYDEQTHKLLTVVPENLEQSFREGECDPVKGWRVE